MNQDTIKNRTIFCGDNIDILRGFNDSSIDLIYLDPPFNKKKQFIAPIGSDAEGAEFKDYWGLGDIKDSWTLMIKETNLELYNFLELSGKIGDKSNKYYLVYMAVRLIEMKRILKDTGSIYLHCDNTMSHYLKLLMDVIFGEKNFRNEIVWHYFKPHSSKKNYPKNYDTLLYYTKGKARYFNFQAILFPYSKKAIERYNKIDEEGRKFKVYYSKDGTKRISYMKEGGKPDNVFDIPFIQGISKERVGYPTQKPLALLERIIEASCPEGGIVLDPFCGCATTCIAAEKLDREWIGIDISKKAYELVKMRLGNEVADKEDMFKYDKQLVFRKDVPDRTDIDYKKLIGKYKKEVKERLYGKQHGDCSGCGQHFHIVHMEVDHIIPKAKGGSDTETNLQLLCNYCNKVKGDRPMEELKAKLEAIRRD